MEDLLESQFYQNEQCPISCQVCYEAVSEMLSFLVESPDGPVLCGHGICIDCKEEFLKRNDACHTCRKNILQISKNIQLSNNTEFFVAEREKAKKEKLRLEEAIKNCPSPAEIAQLQKKLEQNEKAALEIQANQEKRNDELAKQLEQLVLEKQKTDEESKEEKQKVQEERRKLEEEKRIWLEEKEAEKVTKVEEERKEERRKKLQRMEREQPRTPKATKLHTELDNLPARPSSPFASIGQLVSSFVWSSPGDEISLVEEISCFEVKEKRGKNRKTSRVCRALKNNDPVALKQCPYDRDTIFPNSLVTSTLDLIYLTQEERNKKQQELSLKQAEAIYNYFREATILKNMSDCIYINSLKNVVPAERGMFFIELEFVEKDLDYVLELDDPRGIDQILGLSFPALFYQLLSAVYYLHSSGIVHRNLSPSAILFQHATNRIQLCSFGKAISVDSLRKSPQDSLRFQLGDQRFAAPELSTCSSFASIPSFQWKSIDMWSVGCIMAALLRKKSLFEFAKSKEDRISNICSVSECRPKGMDNDDDSHCPLKEFVAFQSEEQKNLIDRILSFDAEERFTAEEALNHPYFNDIKNHEDTITMPVSTMSVENSDIFAFFSRVDSHLQ